MPEDNDRQKCFAMLTPQQSMRMMYMVELMHQNFGIPRPAVEEGILTMLADAKLIKYQVIDGDTPEALKAAYEEAVRKIHEDDQKQALCQRKPGEGLH